MSYSDLFYQVALTMIPDIGAVTAKKLIAYTGSASAVFGEKSSNLTRIPGIGKHLVGRILSKEVLNEAESEVDYITRNDIKVLYYLDDNYPDRLKHCEDGPLLICFRGENCMNSPRIISVVGTRQSTDYGREICQEIIRQLAIKYKNMVIVSGLAYGIDITAHREALSNQLKTVAVLGHGLKTIYPSLHRGTAREISGNGSLVTDFSSSTKPDRQNFIRRNRIIAGLSDATLVIESGEKGGALITAEMAVSYNREVMAVPGRTTDNMSSGCNAIIKRNLGGLVESASDIEYQLNWESEVPSELPARIINTPLTDEERKLIEVINKEQGLMPETISSRTGLPVHRVLALLIEMELRDWISISPGNRYHLKIKLPEHVF